MRRLTALKVSHDSVSVTGESDTELPSRIHEGVGSHPERTDTKCPATSHFSNYRIIKNFR